MTTAAAPTYRNLKAPAQGEPITMRDGKLTVPNFPVVPFIEGDGTGPDIWRASQHVLDSAVQKAYGGKRKIQWFEVLAGEKAKNQLDDWLPEDTLKAIDHYLVASRGPLTTPVGGGFRSLNVALRQQLDLYAGIEWKARSEEAKRVIDFLQKEMGVKSIRFPESSGIGIKPISEDGAKRLVRSAIRYAIENKRKSVTLVHKGNIMKYTEGAFRDWGYQVAREEFGGTEFEGGPWLKLPDGMIIKDVIADNFLQQIILRPKEYDVIATPNLNGDYISDALAAQVGGIGIAPGANINYVTGHAIFEATHGTAPKYAGKDMVNPGSVILSGEMMLRYLGWGEAADLIVKGLEGAIGRKTVTYDFERLMEGA